MASRLRTQQHQNRKGEKNAPVITHSQLQPKSFSTDQREDTSTEVTNNTFHFSDIGVQPKLTIGEPNDKYEQEADRVASEVVQRINSDQGDVQRSPKEEEEEKEVQRSTIGSVMRMPVQRKGGVVSGAASDDFESQLNQSRGGGSPLEPQLKGKLESAMGADFSQVKVHTGSQSDQLNQSIQAKAFTTGNDVFFKQGEYNPSSRSGQELIAHELTHVVQQNQGAVQRQTLNANVVQRDDTGDKGQKKEKKKAVKRVSGAAALKSFDTIAKANNTPRLLKVLHLRKEFSTENLFFLDAVDSYVSSPSRSKMLEIYNMYVSASGPRMINVSHRCRGAVTSAIQPYIDGTLEDGAPDYLPKVFDAATKATFDTMRDSMYRYKNTVKLQQDVIINNLISTGDLPPDSLTENEQKAAREFAKLYSDMQAEIQVNLKKEPWYKRMLSSAKQRASEGITHG